eukprot:comp24254_c1_seq1/m.44963 comp24254_c1_seq1/g.44963  ORF comp24254_c1_seq1/g.44963 comp24254_c1_seq1/m.44963 type:complete len:634 (-) comp24254_c1_seq1:300-2201(-)
MEALNLPLQPANWPAGKQVIDHNPLTAPVKLHLEPAGRWFEAYASRRRRGRTLSQEEAEEAAGDTAGDQGESSESETEEEEYKGELDPTKPKELDPYKLLGLDKLRWKATDEQIKRAYRKKVLKHHPDKKDKKANGQDDDDYFKCIKIANDILSDQTKRRSYDSVDPSFDDSVPAPVKKVMEPAEFFTTFAHVFESNSRFSEIQPVPLLGTMESTQEEVADFYDFWYAFKSWREFSYLDDDEEKAENREEKRWLEKEKKAERKQQQQEEKNRIIKLVDNAFKADPRIQLFKEQEKQEKLAKKQAKQAAQQAEREAQEKAREAERLEKERAEQLAKEAAAEEKRKKEEQKKVIKQARKNLRQLCKDAHYFVDPKDTQKTLERVAWVDVFCERLTLEELNALVDNFSKATFEAQLSKSMDQHTEETNSKKTTQQANNPVQKRRVWSDLEEELLVKAVKTFPAGTRQRWDVMANYINIRHPESKLTGEEVLSKVKERQHVDKTLQEKHNEEAYAKFEKKNKHLDGGVEAAGGLSKRFDSDLPTTSTTTAPTTPTVAPSSSASTSGAKDLPKKEENAVEWTPDQQKALENALRVTKDLKEGRWEKIAEMVPGKTKKDCMLRYKQLAEAVKAKKAQKT